MSDLQFILAIIPALVTLGLIGWLAHAFSKLDQLRREVSELQARLRESQATQVELAHWVVKADEGGIRVDMVTREVARNLIVKS